MTTTKVDTRISRRTLLSTAAAAGAASFVGPVGLGARRLLAQAKPIKIGVLAPLSGVYTSLGQNKVNGITMYLEEQGMKVGERPIQIIREDTEANPQVGLRKARRLVEDENVDVLLGVISSAIGYALKEYVARARKVWVTTGAAADGIFKKSNNNPYAFRSSLSVWQANYPMGEWMAKQNIKRVFVTGPDYAMGREAIASFRGGFGSAGPQVVGEAYAPLNTNDFAPFLAQIKAANPDCVYASYAGGDAVRFVKQFSEFGLRKSIRLAGYGYIAEEDLFDAQGEAVVGVWSALNYAYGIDTPANKTFIANYRKRYSAAPTVDSVAGYVGAQVVYEAIKSMCGQVTSQEALSKAILAVKFDSPRGPISFDPATNNVIQNIYIREAVKMDDGIHNRVLAVVENVKDPGT